MRVGLVFLFKNISGLLFIAQYCIDWWVEKFMMKWNSLELWIFPLCCVRAGGRRRARGSRAREREQWLSLLCPIPGGHGGAGGGPNLPAVSPGLCPGAGLVFCILSWGTAWHTYTLPAHAARDPLCLVVLGRIFHCVGGCWGQVIWGACQKLSLSGLRFCSVPCVPSLCYAQKSSRLENIWVLWLTTFWNSHVFHHVKSIRNIQVIIVPCLLIYFKSKFFS